MGKLKTFRIVFLFAGILLLFGTTRVIAGECKENIDLKYFDALGELMGKSIVWEGGRLWEIRFQKYYSQTEIYHDQFERLFDHCSVDEEEVESWQYFSAAILFLALIQDVTFDEQIKDFNSKLDAVVFKGKGMFTVKGLLKDNLALYFYKTDYRKEESFQYLVSRLENSNGFDEAAIPEAGFLDEVDVVLPLLLKVQDKSDGGYAEAMSGTIKWMISLHPEEALKAAKELTTNTDREVRIKQAYIERCEAEVRSLKVQRFPACDSVYADFYFTLLDVSISYEALRMDVYRCFEENPDGLSRELLHTDGASAEAAQVFLYELSKAYPVKTLKMIQALPDEEQQRKLMGMLILESLFNCDFSLPNYKNSYYCDKDLKPWLSEMLELMWAPLFSNEFDRCMDMIREESQQ